MFIATDCKNAKTFAYKINNIFHGTTYTLQNNTKSVNFCAKIYVNVAIVLV